MTRPTLLLLVVTSLACTNPAASNPGGAATEAVLAIIQGDGSRLMRASADGRDTLTLLAETFVTYSNLSVSPDGSLALFNRLEPGGSSPGPVYGIAPDGQDLTPFPDNGSHPRWSPDGSQIAWLQPTDGGTGIILTDRLGNGPDTVAFAEDVTWSPDGAHLAITYRPANTDQEIGTIDLLQSRERTNRSAAPGDDYGPSWSPDGSWIAFFSARPSAPGLYLMRPDGSDQHRLLPAAGDSPPQWSPDGLRIAVITSAVGTTTAGLHIVRLDGTEVSLPAGVSPHVRRFAWSPSGKRGIVALADSLGRVRLQITSASAASPRSIPLPTIFAADPQWVRLP